MLEILRLNVELKVNDPANKCMLLYVCHCTGISMFHLYVRVCTAFVRYITVQKKLSLKGKMRSNLLKRESR